MRFLAATLLLSAVVAAEALADPMTYPATPKIPVTETYHGTAVVDVYRWLENDQAPEVKQWVVAQNARARLPGRSSVS